MKPKGREARQIGNQAQKSANYFVSRKFVLDPSYFLIALPTQRHPSIHPPIQYIHTYIHTYIQTDLRSTALHCVTLLHDITRHDILAEVPTDRLTDRQTGRDKQIETNR